MFLGSFFFGFLDFIFFKLLSLLLKVTKVTTDDQDLGQNSIKKKKKL